jgi:hypothetical protein
MRATQLSLRAEEEAELNMAILIYNIIIIINIIIITIIIIIITIIIRASQLSLRAEEEAELNMAILMSLRSGLGPIAGVLKSINLSTHYLCIHMNTKHIY